MHHSLKHSFWLLAFPIICLNAVALAAPEQIHLSWQGRTDSTMTVTWRSTASEGQVEFGSESNYGQMVKAQSIPYANSYLHIAEVTGLSPGNKYHYRCGTTNDWSKDCSFSTASTANSALRFVVFGDTQHQIPKQQKIVAQVQKLNPAFIIAKGDHVESGKDQNRWDKYFTTMQDLLSVAPLMSVGGNHENNARPLYDQFAFPVHSPSVKGFADEAYYSFDYANIHFVGLSTQPVDDKEGSQKKWLEADLAKAASRQDIKWIMVYGHQPPYSSGYHGGNKTVLKSFVPLFEKYNVDIAFWGHEHSYERTKSIRQGKVVEEGGITYINCGSSASNLREVGSSWFTAFSKSLFHFVEVNVTENEISINSRNDQGEVFDHLVLNKMVKLPLINADSQSDEAVGKGDSLDNTSPSDESNGACSMSAGGWKSSFLVMLLPIMALGLLGLAIRRQRHN